MARVDAICDDAPPVEDTLPLPPAPSTKHSPSHSISSSSSGSYCLPGGGKKPSKTSTSPRTSIVKPITANKLKTESISDDEKSEKRYSSSGYYESPHDDGKPTSKNNLKFKEINNKDFSFCLEPSRPRRIRDWNEDERRRRKEKMRLDIEKENMKSLTSPSKKTSPAFKQISPDDRAALNTLDGTNPSKTKRVRPKTRRRVQKKKKN